MSLSEEDCTAKLEDLSAKQLQTLDDWESKFKTKYPVVGKVSLRAWTGLARRIVCGHQ